MKPKYLMVVNAVIDVILGIALVLLPGSVLALFTPMPMYNPLAMQIFGADFIGFAVLNFFARNASEGNPLLRPILLANLVTNLIAFVLALIVQLGGTATTPNWATVVLTLVFAVGYAYYLVLSFRPGASVALSSEREHGTIS